MNLLIKKNEFKVFSIKIDKLRIFKDLNKLKSKKYFIKISCIFAL